MEELLASVCRAAEACAAIARVFSPNDAELQTVGAYGVPPDLVKQESIVDCNCGVCGKAAYGRGIGIADSAGCAAQRGMSFFKDACRSVVALPMEWHGQPIGVLSLFFAEPLVLDDAGTRKLCAYADLVSVALGNLRQNREKYRNDLMAERQSLANEIHDSLSQTLVYARMRLNMLSEVLYAGDDSAALKYTRDIDEVLKGGQKEIRELITHFRAHIDHMGLQYALQSLADEFQERTGIEIEYVNRVPDLILPVEYELHVFHVVREAFANIAKHSGASKAKLAVECDDGEYRFSVEDNGSGCNLIEEDGHYGLSIMRERAHRIGGVLLVRSGQHSGTQVHLRFRISDIGTEQQR